jgi:pimeloyl-ACP methyl ester carboxylesterase
MDLIFLPGMMCDARLFAPQLHIIPDAKVITQTTQPSIQEMAADIINEAPDQFALMGLSMGGIVAMEVLRQAPERVFRLALLDTNPCAELDAVKERRTPQMDAVRAGNLRKVIQEEMKPNYLVDSPRKPEILDLCMDMAMDLGANAFINQSIALRDRPDQCETLRAYTGPSLVLCGRHDTLCPVTRHEMMHELLANSRLEIIENAGHLPTLEQPEITTAALSRWLEE